jgi:hypothetical protein
MGTMTFSFKFALGQRVFSVSEEYGIVEGDVISLDGGISRDSIVVLTNKGEEITMLSDRSFVNINHEAQKMLDDWKANGFNGVFFHQAYNETNSLDDFLRDGLTEKEYGTFTRNYSVFIADPDLDVDCEDQPYTSTQVDMDKFVSDLKEEMKKRLGDDIKITYRSGCKEYEVERVPR